MYFSLLDDVLAGLNGRGGGCKEGWRGGCTYVWTNEGMIIGPVGIQTSPFTEAGVDGLGQTERVDETEVR